MCVCVLCGHEHSHARARKRKLKEEISREASCQREETENRKAEKKKADRSREKDKKAEIQREGKAKNTKRQKLRAERERDGETFGSRKNHREEESKTAKQYYKPLLSNAVLGPETLAPPENWLEGSNSSLVPNPPNQNLLFLRTFPGDSGTTSVNSLFTQNHFNYH